MALPMTETISSAMCVVSKVETEHVKDMVNSTGADLAAGDFCVIGSKQCGIAMSAIASSASGPIEVDDGIIIQSAALHTSVNTFGTLWQEVYWDDTLKKFVDTTATGRFKIGCLAAVKNSAGVIAIEKYRYATVM